MSFIDDLIGQASPEHREVLERRRDVVNRWCEEHEKDPDDLSLEDILAIRALAEWQRPIS